MKATLPLRSPCVPQARLRTVVASLLAISMLGGCASQNQWLDNAFPELPPRERPELAGTPGQKQPDATSNRFYQTPNAPTRKAPPLAVSPAYTEQNVAGKESAVAFNSMPLPQFIDSVFGVILKKTINIDPTIAQRRDLVSMKTGKPLSNAELYTAAKTVLRSYGIVVQELPGLTRFVPDTADTSSLPEIRRGRALPEVPETLRPLFYLAELENTHITNASNWLRTAFKDKLNLQEDPTRNALLLSGTPQTVTAALQALQVLDQPMMRGKQSVRITPIFWTADELSRRLNDILTAEGYYSSSTTAGSSPIVMVPVTAINSVLVFAASQSTLDHILKWAEELDQPSQVNSGSYFIYPVRNADAADIAATLSQVMSGGQQAAATTTGTSSNATSNSSKPSPRIVVNKATNSLIFQSTASEYQQWFGLIKELDRPAKSALVTVSVAEVRLQDGEQLGFEWLIKNIKLGGLTGNIGTAGAFGTKAIGGLSLTLGESTSPAVILNALATATKARVLSNPTILTRSGEEATITVGQEVPTITSQQSNADSGSSTGGVLQTIQYRNTGVILKVKPVVHAGGRIDLNVSQEVSTVADVKGGTALAPTISTRKVDTKLTVLDGNTVVLGGLMSDNRNNTNSGVPYAKDIPGLGLLFKSDSNSTDRTELIVLITAYSIEDDFDTQSVSDAFRNRFPWSSNLFREAPKRNAGEQASQADSPLPAGTSNAKPYIPRSNAAGDDTSAISTSNVTPTTSSVNSNANTTSNAAPGAAQTTTTKRSQEISGEPGKGKTVTDDALKKELLEALKGSLNK